MLELASVVLIRTCVLSCVPAVNHSRRPCGLCLYVPSEKPSEPDQDVGVQWDSVVGPGGEVKVSECPLL